MTENSTAPVATPLLVSNKAAAAMCGVSTRTWWSLNAAELAPVPLRLGGRTLWRARELGDLRKAFCPARDRWEAIKKGSRT